LSLGLNSIGITDVASIVLGRKLERLALKKLKVDLLFVKLGDRGVNELFLHPLKSRLEELEIDLTFNKLGLQSLGNLTHFLKFVDSNTLKKVNLKLGSNKLEEKGSQHLSQALKRFNGLE
jgi:hypothetical protein